MNNVTYYKTLGAFSALLTLILVLALGCGGSNEPVQSAGPATGSEVGDTIHPFTLRLADGSTVTSADLVSQNRPTFLIFFKHP